ncbi:hypothetical protein [Companilactobacillus sp. DQM5]|uniref:hypothetical protein n=1 Tax=Companilactobacillus sp. DQM5 TaxID=3463359 RepID=UPI004058C875
MIINILMIIFGIVMLIISYYLYKHTNTPFIKIKPEYLTQYKLTTRFISILFLIAGIISLLTIVFNNKTFSIFALLFGSICAAYYAIFISNKFHI